MSEERGFCASCGRARPSLDARFCPHCGSALPAGPSYADPYASTTVTPAAQPKSFSEQYATQAVTPAPAPAAVPKGGLSGAERAVVIGILGVIAVGGYALMGPRGGGGSVSPTIAPTTRPAPTATPTETPEETVAPTPALTTFKAITITGRGNKVKKFTIPADTAAIATITNSGASNFAVWTVAANGDKNKLVVNTIGKYKGTVLFDAGFDEHSVAFQVESSGLWKIVVKPLTSAKSWAMTEAMKGTGDNVLLLAPPSSGLTTLTVRHRGDSNFAIWAFAVDDTDLLVNEIGNFDGESLLPDQTVLLEVTADGTWTLRPS